MTTVLVSSYFKYGERFVLAEDAKDHVADSFYVEGAICITIDGQEFLTLAHADLVDQLWLYLVEGLDKLRAGDVFETYFPDQPTLLTFRPLGPDLLLLTVKTDANETSVQAMRTDMLDALCDGAHQFFNAFDVVVPNHGFDIPAIHAAIDGPSPAFQGR